MFLILLALIVQIVPIRGDWQCKCKDFGNNGVPDRPGAGGRDYDFGENEFIHTHEENLDQCKAKCELTLNRFLNTTHWRGKTCVGLTWSRTNHWNCALYEGNSWAFRDKDKSTLPPIFDLEGVPKKGQDSYGCGICVAPAGGREGDNAGAQAGTSDFANSNFGGARDACKSYECRARNGRDCCFPNRRTGRCPFSC